MPSSPHRLTDTELDELDAFLLREDAHDDSVLDVTQLDAFLTAIAIGPEEMPEDEWLAAMLRGPISNWASESRAERTLGLIRRHKEILAQEFAREPARFAPLIREHCVAEDWADGFMLAVALRPKLWRPLLDTQDRTSPLYPFWLHGTAKGLDRVSRAGFHRGLKRADLERIVLQVHAFWRSARRDAVLPATSPGRRSRKPAPAASNRNRVSIGTIDGGSTVNISQAASGTPAHITYEVDESSVKQVSGARVAGGILVFLTALALPISFLADVLGILSFQSVQGPGVFMGVVVLMAIGVAGSVRYVRMALGARGDRAILVGKGIWTERSSKGGYIAYRSSAPCIYPNCSGRVHAEAAPERERENHSVVGVCDVGGREHTYTYDFNGIGYPQKFDWRRLEPSGQR